jgi:dTDP-4-dehydrorhamnose reductase
VVNKEKVITIGGTGLVGTVLVQQLGEHFNIEDHSIDSPTLQHRIDITDTDSFAELMEANRRDLLAVINLAAATDTSRAYDDLSYRRTLTTLNYTAPRDASLVCRELGIPFLHISTDYVYSGEVCPNPYPYVETDKPNPIEPYGITKFQGESAVLKNGGTVLTLSYPFVENPFRPDLVDRISAKLRRGEFVNAFYDQIITPTYIPDFVKITDLLLRKLTKGSASLRGQKFHCVGSSYESPASVSLKIASHFSYEPTLVQTGSVREYNQNAAKKGKRLYHEYLALSNLKVRLLTDYTPLTFDQGLEMYPNDC